MSSSANAVQSARVSQMGYIGLGVSDLEKWRDFARDVLGLQDNGESATGDLFLRMDSYHHRFILSRNDADDLLYVGYEVQDEAALDAVAARLRAYGIDVQPGTEEQASERMVSRMIRFDDPDGLATEIYHGPLFDHAPFVSPRGIARFVSEDLGFGHIVIAVRDKAAYVRYLTEALGARVSDYISLPIGPMTIDLTFIHVNPRHHTVAVLVLPEMPGAPPAKRLQHFMVEVDDVDVVGAALDLFKQRGLATGALGRHVNDRMLSFYADTPSGFHVEYGYGALRIDNEDQWTVKNWQASSFWGHGMPPRSHPNPAEG